MKQRSVNKTITRIQLNTDLYQNVKKTSQYMGVNSNELINRVILLYLNSIQQGVELKQEYGLQDDVELLEQSSLKDYYEEQEPSEQELGYYHRVIKQ